MTKKLSKALVFVLVLALAICIGVASASAETMTEADFLAALSNAEDGGVVTLTGDVMTANFTVDAKQKFTLDLNGHTLTLNNSAYYDYIYGDLTIKDSEGGGKVIVNDYGIAPRADGKLTVQSGSFEAQGDYLFYLMGGELDIQGGSFSGGYNIINCYAAGNLALGGTVKISGGAFTVSDTDDDGYDGCVIMGFENSSITISGGTFTPSGTATALYVGQGSLNGGVNYTAATATISGGAFTGAVEAGDDAALTISGGTFNDDVTVYDSATVAISGGTFNDAAPDDDYIAAGYQAVKTGATSWKVMSDEDAAKYVIEYTNASGAVFYKTWSSSGVSANGTYKLLADVSLSARLAPGILASNVTLDLNGHTLTSTATDCAILLGRNGSAASPKTFALVDTSANGGGKLIATGLSVSDSSDALISVSGKYNNVTIGAGVTIEGGCVALLSENQTLNVYGAIDGGDDFAIATNGATTKDAAINIYDGAALTSNVTAVYLPGTGTTTVSGGSISGETAVYVKSGSLTISGGAFTGNGTAAGYTYNGNGAYATGDAIVIDSCGYPGGTPSASISGGTFTSTNAKAVACYTYQENKPVTNFITGGSFNNAAPDDAYIAIGYIAVKSADNEGYYEVTAISDATTIDYKDDGSAAATIGTNESSITITSVTADQDDPTDTLDDVKLSQFDLAQVVQEAAVGTDDTEITAIEIGVEAKNVTEDEEGPVTFTVNPVAFVTTGDGNGDPTTVPLSNDVLAQGASFTLDLIVGSGFVAGDTVKVVHSSTGYDDETYYPTVKAGADAAGNYITLTLTHFSTLTVSATTDALTYDDITYEIDFDADSYSVDANGNVSLEVLLTSNTAQNISSFTLVVDYDEKLSYSSKTIRGTATNNADDHRLTIIFSSASYSLIPLTANTPYSLGTLTFTADSSAVYGEELTVTVASGSTTFHKDGLNGSKAAEIVNVTTPVSGENCTGYVSVSTLLPVTLNYGYYSDPNSAMATQTVYVGYGKTLASAYSDAAGTTSFDGLNPTRAGYGFSGWNTATDGNGDTYYSIDAAVEVTPVTAAATVYAQWVPTDYTVTLNLGGGTPGLYPEGLAADNDGLYPYSYDITTPVTISDPIRSGYTFNGWTVTAGDTDENWDEAYASNTIAGLTGLYGSVTLTANWLLDADIRFVDFAYAYTGWKMLVVGMNSNVIPSYGDQVMHWTDDSNYCALLGPDLTSPVAANKYAKVYIALVPGDVTAAQVLAALADSGETDGAAYKIDRSGDITSEGGAYTPDENIWNADLGLLTDLLMDPSKHPDSGSLARLSCDLHTGDGNTAFGSIDDVVQMINNMEDPNN